jgi:spermidine dehydrogenase
MKNITRRDFLNGVALSTAALTLSPWRQLFADAGNPSLADYPPELTGLRGNHPGSFETAHELAWTGQRSWAQPSDTVDPVYDLVIVGAGISGLAAARFYQQEMGESVKILLLDNHDDFGGHAKRNEFTSNGIMRLGYGGSQSMEEPGEYSRTVKNLLADIGVDYTRFESAYDIDFCQRHGLGSGTFFNRKDYGESRVVKYLPTVNSDLIPGQQQYPDLSDEDAIAQMPLSPRAKAQLLKVMRGKRVKWYNKWDLLNISYFDYLKQTFGADDPQLLQLLRSVGAEDFGAGTDVLSALEARYAGAPGFDEPVREAYDTPIDEQYIHHFPDGNASIARLLVRKMIPAVAPGNTMDDIVMARFDYAKLDSSKSPVRLRLNSTVVNVAHIDQADTKAGVAITYINNGKAHRVRAKNCILAGYNNMVPHIAPEFPQPQKTALRQQIKMPLVYSVVELNNWHALKNLGIGATYNPGNLHQFMQIDFPITMKGYPQAEGPEHPMPLTMISVPLSDEWGKNPVEQFKEGRYKLLGMSFQDFENDIVAHLGEMLGPGGFDPERDIDAMTINRWSHGYIYQGFYLHNYDEKAHIKARQPFGRIAIANSDAGASAYMDAAIEQARRAVDELT